MGGWRWWCERAALLFSPYLMAHILVLARCARELEGWYFSGPTLHKASCWPRETTMLLLGARHTTYGGRSLLTPPRPSSCLLISVFITNHGERTHTHNLLAFNCCTIAFSCLSSLCMSRKQGCIVPRNTRRFAQFTEVEHSREPWSWEMCWTQMSLS